MNESCGVRIGLYFDTDPSEGRPRRPATGLECYRYLRERLAEARQAGKDEDQILDWMDVAWREMTVEDRQAIND